MLSRIGLLSSCMSVLATAGASQTWVVQSVAPWTAVGGRPALAFDETRNRLVVVDGRAETWEHDGSTWFRRAVPAPLDPQRVLLAYDTRRRASVLVPTRDPWFGLPVEANEWDGTAWQSAGAVPATASLTAAAYDRARERLVVFSSGQVLERDSVTLQWHVVPAAVPPVRSATYDPDRGDVLVWTGAALHAWNGTVVTPRGSGPLGGYLAYDPLRHRAIVAAAGAGSDETWEWDGTAFARSAVPPFQRATATLGFHAAVGAVVMLGGDAAVQIAPPSGDAWRLDPGGWVPLPPVQLAPRPASTSLATAPVHDTARNRLVLVEPFPGNGTTWEFDGFGWTKQAGAPGYMLSALAYDAQRARTILFGGAYAHGSMAATWSYDGTGWTPVSSPTTPPLRHSHGMCYDAARQEVLLHGGTGGGGPLYDTWTWDGTDWHFRTASGPRIAPTNPPGWRLAFDAARSQIAMMGLAAPFQWEDWIWDGTSWSQRPAPAALVFAVGYDAGSTDLVTLSQDSNGGVVLRRWNGAAWSSQPVAIESPVPDFLWFDPHASRLRARSERAMHVFTTTPSTAAGRGAGCGSPPPRLLARTLPATGADGFGLDVLADGSVTAVFLMLGLTADDRPLPPFLSQPAGCRVYVGTDAITQLILPNAAGFASAGLAVPRAPALRGLSVLTQAFGIDGQLRVVLSAAQDLVVGD